MSETQMDPSRSLGLILGASSFPNAPNLLGGIAFSNSAGEFTRYLSGSHGLRISTENILNLFDDPRSPSDQLSAIGDFLQERQSQRDGSIIENLFLYYVGHGLFSAQRYCLALKNTNPSRIGITSIRGTDLAEVIKDHAIFLRRFLIIDCCFAGSITSSWLAPPTGVIQAQTLAEFPMKGTSLLCAASKDDVALAPSKLKRTLFSDALIKVLEDGNPTLGELYSFSELGRMVAERLRQEHQEFVRPEVHSPEQQEGDIAALPLFPNNSGSSQITRLGTSQSPSVWKRLGSNIASYKLALAVTNLVLIAGISGGLYLARHHQPKKDLKLPVPQADTSITTDPPGSPKGVAKDPKSHTVNELSDSQRSGGQNTSQLESTPLRAGAQLTTGVPGATLASATVVFNVTNDDKDFDTGITITIMKGQTLVARVDHLGMGTTFKDNSTYGPFSIPVLVPLTTDQIGGSVTKIAIHTNGHDTWNSAGNLTLKFSDGTEKHQSISFSLSQSNAQQQWDW